MTSRHLASTSPSSVLEYALRPNVLFEFRLEGAPLDGDHGAPIRLVSPDQYGYVNVKHLDRIELHTTDPGDLHVGNRVMQLLGPHPRACVWEEERHRVVPSWALRHFYRGLMRLMLARNARATARRHA